MPPRATTRSSRRTTSSSASKETNVKAGRAKNAESPGSSPENETDDAYVEEDSDVESLHSDALDEEEDSVALSKSQKRKRNSANASPRKAGSKKSSPRKKRKKAEDEDEQVSDSLELEEGQEIVGEVVQAPKTGRVPPGQISQNTIDFLNQLKKPGCNDREWFKLHEPVYRLAEQEWKDFVEAFTDILVENDPQIPHLPPKDVVHRIYRDVRFSNDKTPYKKGFSASFSRSGRKGIFAGFIPGNKSLIAAGIWQPGKNELQTIRNNIMHSSTRLRKAISSKRFVELFGEAKPHPKGLRQNIFGGDDELKTAPKGVDKTHPEIDLLKCRSMAVVHHFTDQQILKADFKEELGHFVKVLRPFVHCLNDLMTLQDDDEDEDEEEASDNDGEDAE
ncbi:hypothetical protein BXZ70DRAFT_930303 [Cristinia sonorae]|uniref:TIGR02453 family protein n=1 Tax=Cristinia sonorae TaxID=1940300 RepID=A0A8K0XRD0_9AGAR|nr:hypothetical protein BXZ70DRAFT_930303 [Cristinia sonorae]